MCYTNVKHLGILTLSFIWLISGGFTTAGLTAEQILKKAEQKLSASTVIATMDVTIKRPKWTKTMSLKTWSKGTDYAMAYILGPEKDKGTVYLKSQNDVYNYLPNIKKTVKLPATLLAQNWMGSDLSTDDLVKMSNYLQDYNATVSGTETVSGRSCYKITLTPKSTADVIWGKLVLSIDKTDFIQLKTVFYDEDLEVVNTLIGSDIKSFSGKTLASKYIMTPNGKSGQTTTLVYKNVVFSTPIASSFFTKSNMPQVKP